MLRAWPDPLTAARTNSHGVPTNPRTNGNISSVNAHPNTMMNITNQVQRILFTYPAQMTIKPMRMIVSDKTPRSPASFATNVHAPLSPSEAGGYIARTSPTAGGMTDTSAIVKSTLDTKTKSRRICKQHLTFSRFTTESRLTNASCSTLPLSPSRFHKWRLEVLSAHTHR